jgi:FixJ family two-component response regulator
MKVRGPIAIVDDDASIRNAFKRLLRAEGFAVVSYASATEFLESLRVRHPVCVLLDLRMPEIDGFAVLEALRKMPAPPPVIVVTADYTSANIHRATALGALRCLSKPVDASMLVETIGIAIGAGKLNREPAPGGEEDLAALAAMPTPYPQRSPGRLPLAP